MSDRRQREIQKLTNFVLAVSALVVVLIWFFSSLVVEARHAFHP
jgi:hypothetical protein